MPLPQVVNNNNMWHTMAIGNFYTVQFAFIYTPLTNGIHE